MKQYIGALEYILEQGTDKGNRTGVDTRAVFGYQMRFDLANGFPAVTTKKLAWKSVVSELLWFMEGSTDERRLCEILYGTRDPNKQTIWMANADKQGVDLGYTNNAEHKELGPVYGYQWRNFGGVDQLSQVIDKIKNNPEDRRIIISAWNPPDIPKMALPPCHLMAQFDITNGKLSCMMTQRSADAVLGIPFNIASYALLTHILAQICGLNVGSLIINLGDMHIYHNHFDQVNEQIKRSPQILPTLSIPKFNTLQDVLDSEIDDYVLLNYTPMPSISAPMAV